jgi:hypothetical protein
MGMLPKGQTPAQYAAANMDKATAESVFSWAPTTAQVAAKAKSAGVPDYTPQTTAGKYAYTIGSFLPGAVAAPGEGLAGVAGNALKFGVVPGLASEAAGEATEGTPYEGAARVVGGLAGGLGAAGAAKATSAATGAAKSFVQPFTAGGQRARAAATLAGSFNDPSAASAALDQAALVRAPGAALGEDVAGSKPTTGQLTGDEGALALERELATKDPARFQSNASGTGAAQQNAARSSALQESVQTAGSPEAVGTGLRQQMSDLTAAEDANVAQAQAQAQQAASGIGAGAPPEQVGANLRSALLDAQAQTKAGERQLWQGVDPNGTLTLPGAPVAQAASKIAGSVGKFGAPIEGIEADVFGKAQNLPPTASFKDMTDLRSYVSTAMRQTQQQNPSAYARLTQLRGAIEDSIVNAAQNSEAQRQAAEAARFPLQRDPNTGQMLPAPPLPPATNVDQATAARLAAASAATKARAQAFGQGPVGNALATQGGAGNFRSANSSVPNAFFKSGPGGAEAVESFRNAAAMSGPPNMNPMLDAASESLRREAMDENGVLDPKAFATWKQNHQDALRALPPDLQSNFENAAAAGQAYGEAASARKQTLDAFQKSLAGKIAGLNSGTDITDHVGRVFGKPDAVKQMSDLSRAVGSDPEAKEGLRKAILDHVMSKVEGTTEAGASGVNKLKGSVLQRFLRENSEAMKAGGFSNDEVNSMQAVANDLQRSQRTLEATRLPGQSNTAQDILKSVEAASGPHKASLLGKMTIAGLAGFGEGGIHHAVVGAGLAAGEHLVAGLRGAGVAKASALVREALENPELARALLKEAPARGARLPKSLLATLAKRSMFGVSALAQGRASAAQ